MLPLVQGNRHKNFLSLPLMNKLCKDLTKLQDNMSNMDSICRYGRPTRLTQLIVLPKRGLVHSFEEEPILWGSAAFQASVWMERAELNEKEDELVPIWTFSLCAPTQDESVRSTSPQTFLNNGLLLLLFLQNPDCPLLSSLLFCPPCQKILLLQFLLLLLLTRARRSVPVC